ncbi:MAG: DUF4334 domain-containing protein [Oceanococcaceae bacterium]
MTNVQDFLQRGSGTTDEALAAFDTLPAVDFDFMQGRWVGRGLATGHPMDGLLELYGWYGKAFDSPENVHPLLFGDCGQHCMEPFPLMATMGLLGPNIARKPVMKTLFGVFSPVFRTRKHRARMRSTEFRGKVTATMIYDGLPINDLFVKVDDDTVMGLMDLKGLEAPFFWRMQRETPRG